VRRVGGSRPAGAGPDWSRAQSVNGAYAGLIDLDALPHPNGLFVIDVPRHRHPGRVIEALVRLFGDRRVYLQGGPAPAPAADPRDLSFLSARRDGDLAGPAPRGLGFAELHARGIRGEGIRIVDVEQGFRPHPDLPPGLADRILWGRSAGPARELDHGTATLGLLGARGLSPSAALRGFSGLAPEAELYFASPWSLRTEVAAHLGGCDCGRAPAARCTPCAEALATLVVAEAMRTGCIAGVLDYSVESAILGALFAKAADDRPVLRPGDVMLLEVQTPRYRLDDPSAPPAFCPVQTEPGIATAMALAVAAGVTVVQAAGNAGLDVDALLGGPMPGAVTLRRAGVGRYVAEPIPGDVGAITVGGVAWDLGDHTRHDATTRAGRFNFGTRVDTCGWGEGVLTLAGDSGSVPLAENFGGTSAGAAQVAAVVALLQSRLLRGAVAAPERADRAYGSPALRALLRDHGAVGVPSAPADRGARGPVGEAPDLRRLWRDGLRLSEDAHFVTSHGPRGTPVAAITPALGAADRLSVQFRVALADRPSGASALPVTVGIAQGLPATLFCALEFGADQRISIPPARLGRTETVALTGAPPTTWPGRNLVEHCTPCLRGQVTAGSAGALADVGPAPAEYARFHGAHYLLQHENNVRLNTAMLVREPARDWHELPFWLVGDPDADREMVLSVQMRGFRQRVELRFLDPLPESLVPGGASASFVVIPPVTNPTAVLQGVFPRGLRCRALLVVTASDRDVERGAELSFSQTWLGDEVGALSWAFAAALSP
jgi:hypothetical protein